MSRTKVPAEYQNKTIARIAVNQIGYQTNDQKIAVIRGEAKGRMYVCKAKTGEVVFEADANPAIFDGTNKIYVRHFDFSDFKENGTYYIHTEQGKSYTFEVCENPYREVTNAMIKALYYQRCGMELEKKHAGDYAHKACHNIPAYLLTDKDVIFDDVSGGWHDAGDYGKYVTCANQTVFSMIYAYELFPSGVSDDLNIPESGNGVPDILNEARYELDWMLKMQDKKTGGVYHKVTTEKFAGNVMPDEDYWEIQAMSPITVTATGGFAGAMAAAARAYKKYDPDFAAECLSAAKAAFDYAYANYKDAKSFQNIPPCITGVYGDDCCLDEVYWAAAELFRTTGEKVYEEKFEEFFNMDFPKTMFSAYFQGGMGSVAFSLCENAREDLRQKVIEKIVEGAEEALTIYNRNGYLLCLHDGINATENEYYWGSNGVLCGKLSNMISAAILKKTDRYDNAIRGSMAYIFGRNYPGVCYVTGFGSNGAKKPHHRPSMFDGVEAPVPGLLIGGPNDRKGQRPEAVKGVKQAEDVDWENMPPAGCFVDWEWNWTTNEITIYWNAVGFYVSGYLNSLI